MIKEELVNEETDLEFDVEEWETEDSTTETEQMIVDELLGLRALTDY